MNTLTSVQEAAFNAAGEAIADLRAGGLSIFVGNHSHGEGCAAFESGISGPPLWGKGATGAEAVADLLRQVKEREDAPPKLTTAKEAINAVKEMAEELCDLGGDVPFGKLSDALDALPVA